MSGRRISLPAPTKTPSLSETVTAFLSPDHSAHPVHSSTTPDITDTKHKDKDKDTTENDATSLTRTTTSSFSVLGDIRSLNYQPTNHPTVSADNSLSLMDTTTMTHSTQKGSDVTSLSTDNSLRDKAFLNYRKPQVTTIMVQEKGPAGRKKQSSYELSPDKQNPHIILVEPEHSTSGGGNRQSLGHVPILREPPEAFLAPLGATRRRAKSYPYEDTETATITPPTLSPTVTPAITPAITPSLTPNITPSMSPIKEEEMHMAGFKKFAALKLKARKWMKRSGVGEPSDNEVETAMQQQKRPFVEIPRHLKLDVWKEAYPIVQRIHESYKNSLGEQDPLTESAEAYLETHKTNFKGGTTVTPS